MSSPSAPARTPLDRAAETRRSRLVAALPGPALLPAGRARGRNYPANTYPFRASSHFLYFVGRSLEGAALWIEPGRAVLLVPEVDPHAALWHGETATIEELRACTGLEIASFAALAALRGGRAVATVPPLDLREALELGRALERDPVRLGSEGCDEPLLDAIIALRLRHDAAALGELERAAAISVRAHQAGMRATRTAASERELCAVMEYEFARAGAVPAYGSIVSVHGEVLHNDRHDNDLAPGDLLLADVGAESDSGYASDITRTWPVSGRFSPTQRAIYELVLAMQREAIARVRPGVRYRDIHLAASRALLDGLVQLGILRGEVDALLEDGVQALFFPHGIGHLLGLDVHDMEDLGDRAGYARGRSRSAQFGLGYLRLDRDLEPSMLVTIEPGFYQVPYLLADPARFGIDARPLQRERLEAFRDVRGIRIEDDVLVTEGEPRVLTAGLAKEPEEVEAMVLGTGD